MKSLFVMRHSYAMSENPAFSDKERPLTDHGRTLTQQTAELLTESGVTNIICSSAIRTVQTAEIVGAKLGLEFQAMDSLYLASRKTYLDTMLRCVQPSDRALLLIGHNPGVGAFINSWATTEHSVPPCTVAEFTSDCDQWSDFLTTAPRLTQLLTDGQRQRIT